MIVSVLGGCVVIAMMIGSGHFITQMIQKGREGYTALPMEEAVEDMGEGVGEDVGEEVVNGEFQYSVN